MKKHKTSSLITPTFISPYNSQHIGRREEQQDYFSYSDVLNKAERERIGAVAVLADGMGGMENGYMASQTAVRVFMETYTDPQCRIYDVKERMLYALEAANEAVKGILDSGSTLCAVVIKDWRLYWISVGDSRIYLYRNENIRQINHEHIYQNILNKMVQNGEISMNEMINSPHREALTSFLGLETLTEIDICQAPLPLFSGDSVMLCSDGLYRSLTEKEISIILRDGELDVCDVLVKSALDKNYPNQDNITVALMDID